MSTQHPNSPVIAAAMRMVNLAKQTSMRLRRTPTLYDSLENETPVAGTIKRRGSNATFEELQAHANRLRDEMNSASYRNLEHPQIAEFTIQDAEIADPAFELAATLSRMGEHPDKPQNMT